MEDGSEHRHWDELIPDALGLIFSKLPLQDILTVVPRVCKSWGKAVSGPYCWQEIDLEEYSNWCHQYSNWCRPNQIDRMLRLLITRSCGSLRKLCVTGLDNDTIFSFLADHAGSLRTLRVTRSEMTDSVVEQIAGRLSTITFLDVSYCSNIGASALEAIGKHCKLLVGLCRNTHPLYTELTQDDEARAIATTMPKLKHLEMAYHSLSTESLLEILSSCPQLEFIDLRGCWNVKLDEKFLGEKFPKLKVLGPLVDDVYDTNNWNWDDYSETSEYLAWEFLAEDIGDFDDDESFDGMWDDEQRLEELELRFYETVETDPGLYGWPPSP